MRYETDRKLIRIMLKSLSSTVRSEDLSSLVKKTILSLDEAAIQLEFLDKTDKWKLFWA